MLDIFIESRDASVRDFDRMLESICARIDDISRMPAIAQRDFAELTALYNNASYILLYLDANAAHIEAGGLQAYRDALCRPGARSRRLSALVAALELDDPDAEAARTALLAHFAEESGEARTAEDAALAQFRQAALRWRRSLDLAKQALLARLGVQTGGGQGDGEGRGQVSGRPDAAFYALMSRTEDPGMRRKLASAWRSVGARDGESLIAAIDAVVTERRRCSRADGHRSVAERTLAGSRLGAGEITVFLERSLELARREHDALEGDLARRYGPGGVQAHFPRHVAEVRAGRAAPAIALQPCVDFALRIARLHFGLEARRVEDCPAHMITYDMARDGRPAGRINFDLWGAEAGRSANTTSALRSGADWAGVIQQPVAHISCRFRKRDGRVPVINFQNAHSLFHEFGHALNHILVRPRLPNFSGLDYLPPERLEILSMWFERWVFHPEFERHLDLAGEGAADLEICREIKRLEYVRTHLERNVLAMLDFRLNASDSLDVAGAYHELDRRFGVAASCPLGDLLASFSWPMLTARPGAYFGYLWAAARSAELFEPLRAASLDHRPCPADTMGRLRECFEVGAPSRTPDIDALYRFYRPGADSAGGRGAA